MTKEAGIIDGEKKILIAILRQQAIVEVSAQALPIIETYLEKGVTKHIATAIQKVLPNYRVSYDPNVHGWKRITVTGGAFDWDNRFTIDFTRPEEYLKIKTTRESVEAVIELLKAWQENGKEEIIRLKKDRDNFRAMVKDWQELNDAHAKNVRAFTVKYGSAGHFSDHELTYTVREALRLATDIKPE